MSEYGNKLVLAIENSHRLEEENNQLKIHVAELNEMLKLRDGGAHDECCKSKTFTTRCCNCYHDEAMELLDKTPAQSLLLHDANLVEQVRDGFESRHYDIPGGLVSPERVYNWLSEIASDFRSPQALENKS
jgi:hypothetical protein